ncbi:nuclease-related domain-containing protein [Sutcliffiella rhizosphaerae]|uniref:NERD domain-containing protein n=1 Tax=Sutcliffiella rhizosphaerae TaxID=2880967 RepID=A0ABN8A795_9BACI|nr:nuclease-related domain-containing protein [Sutcliffiella rhizosphaerae]CAG9619772.1 hypothetical protein BACCIP111883_00540 [Sutcliffiella rhizosphaerae]
MFKESVNLQKLQVLKKRLKVDHPKYMDLENEIRMKTAGEYGEYSINYYLSLIPELKYDFQIVRGLRLPFKNSYFQIDTLLLFPSFFLILEVKHLTGTLHFDPNFHQLLQTKNIILPNNESIDETKSIPDPILQVKRQFNQLKDWFDDQGYTDYRGDSLVVLTNTNAIVKAISDNKKVQDFVVRSPGLSFRVEKLIRKHENDDYLYWEELKVISKQLKSSNVVRSNNDLEEFNVQVSDIHPGVFCTSCEVLLMVRVNGIWKCIVCNHVSKDAHVKTIDEYFLLFGNEISSRDCMWFLQLNSTYIARSILKSMKLNEVGNTFSKRYHKK